MKARQTIYYWDGIFDINNLMAAEYQAVMQRLINGEYAELNLEKLRGYNVYSIRINKADRVLFTTIKVNGRPYLMILDIVENHDYKKSRFLKKNVLREYIEHFDAEVFESVIEDHFEKCNEFKLNLPKEDGEYDYVPAKHFGNKYIEFDTDQQKACKASLPLILTGAAGAGKSCAGFQIITNYATQNYESLSRPLLYVAASANLCRAMQRNWESLPVSGKFDKKLIQYKTYVQVINDIDPFVANLTEVGKEEFINFITARIKLKKNHDKAKHAKTRLSDQFFNDKEALYQECRIICGCETLTEYENLGVHQAILKDKAQRQWLYNEYQEYLNYLNANNKFDYSFYTPKTSKYFELIVVDETPDLSRLQVKVLRNLSINPKAKYQRPNIVYCEDQRQNLNNNIDMRSHFGILLNAKQEDVSFISLNASHRCPVAVVKMADSMTELGAKLTGQRAPQRASLPNEIDHGEVLWLDNLTQENVLNLQKEGQSTNFAVVTLPEYIAQAKAIFKTELVFTVEQIKGLEYSKIVMYRLMNSAIYFTANNLLALLEKQGSKSEGQDQFGPAFNLLYTACTRATQTLVIVEDNVETSHKLLHLTKWLKSRAIKSEFQPKVVNIEPNWFTEAKNQLLVGNIKIAHEICNKRLKMTDEEFNQFKMKYLGVSVPESKPVVKSVNSVSVNKPATIQKKKTIPKKKKVEIADTAKIQKEVEAYAKEYLHGECDPFKIKQIFEDDNLQHLLFVPLGRYDNECLFTLLLDNDAYRPAITEVFLPENPGIAKYFSIHSLGRANKKVATLEGKMPPFFWLAQSSVCIAGLMTDEIFVDILKKIFRDKANHYLFYVPKMTTPDITTCPLYWLTTSQPGMLLLAEIFSNNLEIAGSIPVNSIFNKHRYLKSYSSIFSNLYQNDIGLGLLLILLQNNDSFAKFISLEDLFPIPYSEYDTPRLLNVVRQKVGHEFILDLQTLRPDLTRGDLTKINELEAFAMQDKYTNPELIYEKELKWIRQLLLNPVEANFDNLFKNGKWQVYMFDVPVKNGECLFTILFDEVATRHLMLTYVIPKYSKYFAHNITGQALCRVELTEDTMPPLFWLVGNEKFAEILYSWLSVDQRLLGEIDAYEIFEKMPLMQYMRSGLPNSASAMYNDIKPFFAKDMMVSAFKFMLLHNNDLLPRIMLAVNESYDFTLQDLLEISYVSTQGDERKQLSLLNMMCKHQYGLQTLSIILKHKEYEITKKLDDQILCSGAAINNGEHVGSCILFDMCDSRAGMMTLGAILCANKKLQKSIFADILLYGFMKESNDDSLAVKRLIFLCSAQSGIYALNHFISDHLELIDKFDPSLFSDEFSNMNPAKNQSYKYKLIKLLETNAEGRLFLTSVRKYLTDKHAEQTESNYARFSLFAEESKASTSQSNAYKNLK